VPWIRAISAGLKLRVNTRPVTRSVISIVYAVARHDAAYVHVGKANVAVVMADKVDAADKVDMFAWF
jgi:hypothetical protein